MLAHHKLHPLLGEFKIDLVGFERQPQQTPQQTGSQYRPSGSTHNTSQNACQNQHHADHAQNRDGHAPHATGSKPIAAAEKCRPVETAFLACGQIIKFGQIIIGFALADEGCKQFLPLRQRLGRGSGFGVLVVGLRMGWRCR